MNVLRTATLTLATGLLVLAPVAADAASYIGQDTRSDVVTIDPDTGTMKPAPQETNGDILNSGVSHGAHRVTIATRFAALHPDDADGHVFRILTDRGQVRQVTVFVAREAPRGRVIMTKGTGRRVKCHGLSTKVDYVGQRVTVSVPRSCLGRPRWVKVGIATVRFADSILLDDAQTDGKLYQNPKYGPLVKQG